MNNFVRGVGLFFLVTGALNFFVTYPFEVHLPTAQALLHIITGGIGITFSIRSARYLLTVGIVCVVLAIMGFAGMERLLGGIDLTTYFTYLYALIGLACLLAYQDLRNKNPAVASPEAAKTIN